MASTSMNELFAFLQQLMTEKASMFEQMGMHLFRSFAIILLVWFGIKSALAAAGSTQAPAFRFDHFASLVMTIAFGFGMLRFYSQAIPGVGVSFSRLFVEQGLYLANQIDHSLIQELSDRLNNVASSMEATTSIFSLNLLLIVWYLITVTAIAVVQALTFGVIGFGYIAVSVAVLLGPVFVPFFIVPDMEWLFWGWLRSLIQYAFYPVVANAYIYVFARLLVRYIDSDPPPYNVVALFIPFLMLLFAFAYGVIKIPSLVNSIFTGRSGESALPRI